ncbi:MAG: hypothetical protein ACO1QB_10975, partial [Verrucomicrobiales bacterium]
MRTDTCTVEYTYDAQGRMKTMKTWKTFATGTGAATTTWNYDSYRGWPSGKMYADANGPTYTYKSSGRLNTRSWDRGVTTTYAYNNFGDLSGVTYSDTTAGVTYTYDRLGRKKTIVKNSMTTTFAYNDAGQVLSESYSGGTLSGRSVTNNFNNYLQRT